MVDIMADFTHSAVVNVPAGIEVSHVGGYVSGTSDIVWTGEDWSKYPQVHVRYEQGYGGFTPDMSGYDVLDIENGAWTPEAAANEVKRRVENGYIWTTLYGNDSALQSTETLIRAMGEQIWVGHVDCILANWDLNEQQAGALIGTLVHGMTCRGVQWASPSSNPDTLVPGTSLTLRQANVDLNAVMTGWNPAASARPPVPVPVPTPGPVVEHGIVCYVNGAGALVSGPVSSQDGGVTWR